MILLTILCPHKCAHKMDFHLLHVWRVNCMLMAQRIQKNLQDVGSNLWIFYSFLSTTATDKDKHHGLLIIPTNRSLTMHTISWLVFKAVFCSFTHQLNRWWLWIGYWISRNLTCSLIKTRLVICNYSHCKYHTIILFKIFTYCIFGLHTKLNFKR